MSVEAPGAVYGVFVGEVEGELFWGGDGGGKVVAKGTPEKVAETEGSYTGHYLKPMLKPKKAAAK